MHGESPSVHQTHAIHSVEIASSTTSAAPTTCGAFLPYYLANVCLLDSLQAAKGREQTFPLGPVIVSFGRTADSLVLIGYQSWQALIWLAHHSSMLRR